MSTKIPVDFPMKGSNLHMELTCKVREHATDTCTLNVALREIQGDTEYDKIVLLKCKFYSFSPTEWTEAMRNEVPCSGIETTTV